MHHGSVLYIACTDIFSQVLYTIQLLFACMRGGRQPAGYGTYIYGGSVGEEQGIGGTDRKDTKSLRCLIGDSNSSPLFKSKVYIFMVSV